MADVDMTDAPSTSAAPTKKVASKAKAGEGGDGKKRFEVKKVRFLGQENRHTEAELIIVERGSFMGLGHCR
jgi:hypothetical protein